MPNQNEKLAQDDLKVLSQLPSFDPSEVLNSVEYSPESLGHCVTVTVTTASSLINEAKTYLEKENFMLLEFMVHRLRGIFITTGCQRLAFLFENMYKNLMKTRADYLRVVFNVVMNELVETQEAIKVFFETNFSQEKDLLRIG